MDEEGFYWKAAGAAALLFLFGIWTISYSTDPINANLSGTSSLTLVGAISIGISIASAIVSRFWTRFESLPAWQQFIVIAPIGATLLVWAVVAFVFRIFADAVKSEMR